MHFLKIKKKIVYFLVHFQSLHKIWNYLEAEMSLRGDVFVILETAKNRVT